ncbi:DUF6765 family protein [Lyticum sinuosum]|uniref:Uncharacterized protein n=1 Tax=Lyticum sinuosum TaxID=1332059 RepID=A0AAE5AHH9_9RICK|nr:DUF6765 family protein [Lyticum sinuosum]MDZ5761133.1 hypothetical protein [Lyticum sinuosum]
MDVEFHYYINFLVASAAGFNPEEAYTIAYSSQYVDDNTELIAVLDETCKDYCKNIYWSQPTQVYKLDVKSKIIDQIYLTTHFIPGSWKKASKLRLDKMVNLLTVTPNSHIAQSILKKALINRNLYRIGIASHAYCDTWAHQNFVGRHDAYNICNKLSYHIAPYLNKKLLAIGHIEVLDNPDLINKCWIDSRLEKYHINNKKRFYNAAYCLYIQYRRHYFYDYRKSDSYKKDKKWSELSIWLKKIITTESIDHRYDMYNQSVKILYNTSLREYDNLDWKVRCLKKISHYSISNISNSIKNNITNITNITSSFSELYNDWQNIAITNNKIYCWYNRHYTNDDWYHFQEAARDHINYAWNIIENRI